MALHRIGNYELLGELGRGGMGVVYRGVDSFIKRPVAIKTIYLSEIQEEQERQFLRERLYREAQSAGILSHPNIVTIYQIGEQDEVTYIAMEFVDGQNLADVLRKREQGQVTLEFLASVFAQTASALDHAHTQGVIHRDVKPANIIVRGDGVAKITDFGIAKISSQTVTRTGMTLGTPHFMAPEQIQGKKLDGRADQYSLGVVMYEAITGKRPFTADSMTTLIFKIVSDEPDPKRDNPELNDAVSAVLKRALAKNPDDRFPSCVALAHAFSEAAGLAGTAAQGFSGYSGAGQHSKTGTQPMPAGFTGYGKGTGAFPPPLAGAGHTSGYGVAGVPTPMPYAGTSVATPTPTPTPTPHPSMAQAPPVPPAQPTAASRPAAAALPVPDWQTASTGTGHAAGAAYGPVATAGPVSRKNVWLAPLLVVLGLALVGGIFGLFQLFRSAPDTKQEPRQVANALTPTAAPDAGATPTGASSSGPGADAGEDPANTASAVRGAALPTREVGQTGGSSSAANRGSSSPTSSVVPAQPTSRPSSPKPASAVPTPAKPYAQSVAPKPVVSPRSEAAQTPRPLPAATTQPVTPAQEAPAANVAPTATTPVTPSPAASAPAITTSPRPTLRVPAVYPSAARRDGVSGTVALRALVSMNGVPTNIEVVKGIRPDLDKAATEALARWRFQPGTADGKPVDARVNVEITFNLVQDSRKPVSLRNP